MLFSLDEILTVLSSPMRRQILELLSGSGKPSAYSTIWAHFDLRSTGSLNHHLRALTDQGLITRQKSGYVLTPKGKLARTLSTDLENSYLEHVLGQSPGGEEMRTNREIQIKPVEKGDLFRYVLKPGSVSSKGPLTEERVKEELEGNREQWLSLEAQGIHGARIATVVDLLAIEDGHCGGNISGREERIDEVGLRRIIIDNLNSFGDPIVSFRLVAGVVEYAKKRRVDSILFCLDDPQDPEEAAIVRNGGKLYHEATHRFLRLAIS